MTEQNMDRAALEEALAVTGRVTSCGSWYFTPDCCDHLRAVLAAARAHLETLPKTRMVDVWRVECAVDEFPHISNFRSMEEAEIAVGTYRKSSAAKFTCIRVTGPHKQCVPA